jgi:hypothetical protein
MRADRMGNADEGNGPAHLTQPAFVLRLACQVARTPGAARRCHRRDPVRGRRMHRQPACTRCTKECEAECTGRDRGPHQRFPRLCTPTSARLNAWQGNRWRATTLWCDVDVARFSFKSANEFSNLRNSTNCQLSWKSPKIKVVEEI